MLWACFPKTGRPAGVSGSAHDAGQPGDKAGDVGEQDQRRVADNDHRHSFLEDLLERRLGNAAGDEAEEAERRRDVAEDNVDGGDDAEIHEVNVERNGNGNKDRGKDEGSDLGGEEHTGQQQNDVDDQHEDPLVGRGGQDRVP